jgi:hypothetical protein
MDFFNKKTNHYKNANRVSAFALFIFFIAASLLAPLVFSGAAQAATSMKHDAPDYFVPDQRIRMEAQVEDPQGVNLVRCYFKAVGEADLVFVPMNMTGKNEYAGILPAPSQSTTQIEYLFLAVNSAKQVVRSQTFTVTKNPAKGLPEWQEVPKEGEIKVSMELGKPPKELPGFSDNVTIDVVESGARFGVVALLYYELTDDGSSKAAAGQTGTAAGSVSSGAAAGSVASGTALASAKAATGATSAGIITAGAVGWSTAAIVGIGVGAAAVAGGTAAAVSNSSDSDSDNDNNNNNGGSGEELTERTIVGFWNVTGSATSGATTVGTFTYNEDETYSYTFDTTFSDGSTNDTSGTGTWTLNGTNLILTFDAGAVYNGTASGDSDAFTMVSDNGWTLNFKR